LKKKLLEKMSHAFYIFLKRSYSFVSPLSDEVVIGRIKLKVLPLPSSLSIQIRPLRASIKVFAMMDPFHFLRGGQQ
jgi:hypothetical protein